MEHCIIRENAERKTLSSPDYSYSFSKTDGLFFRWGQTRDDDPQFSPFGPEILDLEISSVIHGESPADDPHLCSDVCSHCAWCYKQNDQKGPVWNLSLREFETILSKMPKTLTQIAFGIMNIGTNPDFFPMMEHARANGTIPNFTNSAADVTPEIAKRTAEICGAVAVSLVAKERTYEAIRLFSEAGMEQVNIHFMLAEETFDKALATVEDIAKDARLGGLNAIVFLQYKPKREAPFHPISSAEKFKKLMGRCEELGVRYGFDSCSAPLFFKGVEDHSQRKTFEILAEPCESGLFSSYINCHGQFFACSFSEGVGMWEEGLDVLGCDDFLKDVWYNERTKAWRETILESSQRCDCSFKGICRSCPLYPVTACKETVAEAP